jgi:Holliday junction resolvase RusA-like endonuclease
VITIRVHGIPAPQGSKRHVGNGRMVESSKAVGPWREAVRQEAQAALVGTADGWDISPLIVYVVFVLPRPKGHYGTGRNAGQVKPSAPKYPAGRPDLDKLERAVLDGLTAGGVWRDDSQVAFLMAGKVYADEVPPGAVIQVEPCAWED